MKRFLFTALLILFLSVGALAQGSITGQIKIDKDGHLVFDSTAPSTSTLEYHMQNFEPSIITIAKDDQIKELQGDIIMLRTEIADLRDRLNKLTPATATDLVITNRYALILKDTAGDELVTIDANGNITFGASYVPSAAARGFWDAMEKYGTHRIHELKAENDYLQAEIARLKQSKVKQRRVK